MIVWWPSFWITVFSDNVIIYRVAQKRKPLPNYEKIVLNRIKLFQ